MSMEILLIQGRRTPTELRWKLSSSGIENVIPFDTWLLQIVGYCQLVSDAIGLRRAWVGRDFSRTSVTDFDELYEQVFDDLDSDCIEKELAVHLPSDAAARSAIKEFLNAIRVVDTLRDKEPRLLRPTDLLQSHEWQHVAESGGKVVLLLGRAGTE